jgi:glycine/D-amino acid oxidase-like deaminating enzyme
MKFMARTREVEEKLVSNADVVVVGGGITGCSAVYYLAKRGARVVLVEKGEIAGEGTGASFCGIRQIGRDPAEIPLAIESVRLWQNLATELDHDIGFVQGGCLYTAGTESQLKTLVGYMERDTRAGVGCKMVDLDEIRKLIPILEFPLLGGLYSPRDGHAEAVATCEAYVNAARGLGARIYTNTTCWDIEVSRGRVNGIVTNRGKIRTKNIVNAAGIYAPRVAKMVGFRMPMKVVMFSEAQTEPVQPIYNVWWRGYGGGGRQAVNGSIIYAGPAGGLTDHNISFYDFQDMGIWMPSYFMMRKSVSLHFDVGQLLRELKSVLALSREARRAAEFAIFRPRAETKRLEKGRQALLELMPSLSGVKTARVWAGAFDIVPDNLPLIGKLDDPTGFVMAAGFCGHGFAIGPVVGRLVSEIIIDGEASLPIEPFGPHRFAKGKAKAGYKTV